MISKESLNEFHPGCISRHTDYCFRKEGKYPPNPTNWNCSWFQRCGIGVVENPAVLEKCFPLGDNL